jgi:hypothetical protein
MDENCATGNRSSRRFAIIVVEQAAKPLATLDVADRRANFLARFDDSVAQALMISFRVVMH